MRKFVNILIFLVVYGGRGSLEYKKRVSRALLTPTTFHNYVTNYSALTSRATSKINPKLDPKLLPLTHKYSHKYLKIPLATTKNTRLFKALVSSFLVENLVKI